MNLVLNTQYNGSEPEKDSSFEKKYSGQNIGEFYQKIENQDKKRAKEIGKFDPTEFVAEELREQTFEASTVMLSDQLRHNTPWKLFGRYKDDHVSEEAIDEIKCQQPDSDRGADRKAFRDETERQQDAEPHSDQRDRELPSAIDVANWFINQFDKESGDVITHLKVQKLLYFSEAWCQLLLDRELFSENMEAWAHGPVVREVFEAFKDSDWEPLNVRGELVDFDEDVTDVLEQVLETYGAMSAKTLEYMTCQAQPWKKVRGSLAPEARCTNIIIKESIKEYFKNKYGDQLDG
ncbi:DUF4065 domain-containing protein [Desulfococcaceae bacterium HSG8]|nr:DUF4065 domain-containing protein [Desulfococcaceae bacterium HSG8]